MQSATFAWNHVRYSIRKSALKYNPRIQLPDGTILRVDPETDQLRLEEPSDPSVRVEVPKAFWIREFMPRSRYIQFRFDGQLYAVDESAYECGYAELERCGQILYVRFSGWLESLPPQPMSITEVSREMVNSPIRASYAD